MYHNCFIHSSVDEYLGCFHVLAIVNSSAVNSGIHVAFSILISSGYMPRSGIAQSQGGFIPRFLRYLPSVFQRLYQFTFPPTVQEHFFFSTPFPAFIVCRLFDDCHSDWCERKSHCSFDLHFSNDEWCWSSFHVFVNICMSSLEKCLFRSFPHFLVGLFVFLVLSCMSCLYILEINPLSVVSFAIVFSHAECCLFTLLIIPLLFKSF